MEHPLVLMSRKTRRMRRCPRVAADACILASVAIALLAGRPAAAEEIELVDGDRLTGTILERSDERIVLKHDVLGRIELCVEQVASINEIAPPVGVSHADVALAQVDEAPSETAAGEEPKKEKEWKSKFTLGLGAAFGNTDAQSFNVGAESVRETERMKTALDARYYFGSSDGDRNENRFTAGVLNDWLFVDSPWLFFAKGRYDYDEFQSWEHRLGGHGGVGYKLIEKDDFTLTLRAGAGLLKEFNSNNEDLRPEGLIGGDLTWQISEAQDFVAGSLFYPDLDDTGEFRAVSYAGWSARIADDSNMSVNVRLEHEYQSLVDAGRDHNDLRVTAGLQFDF
jgi:putative salt-induced outer membrane protein YdiY